LTWSLPVFETLTVLQLKELLLEKWSEMELDSSTSASSPPPSPSSRTDAAVAAPLPPGEDSDAGDRTKLLPATPLSPHFLRLRDKTPTGTILRNDRVLSRCLLGLSDGRKVCVQVLAREEIITKDFLVLRAVAVSYSKQAVSKAADVVISKHAKRTELSLLLLEHFPFLGKLTSATSSKPPIDGVDENLPSNNGPASVPRIDPQDAYPDTSSAPPALEIAKCLTVSPPPSFTSTQKLSFISLSSDDGGNLDVASLALRDGSLVMVRSKREMSSAENANAGDAQAPKSSSSSKSGVSIVRARMTAARTFAAVKEKSLSIKSDA